MFPTAKVSLHMVVIVSTAMLLVYAQVISDPNDVH